LKQNIYQHFLQLATEKVSILQARLNDLKESGANETKSTAGDKHETALAMVQIEQANSREQLKDALHQLNFLTKINIEVKSNKIINGSLVKTNKGYFFISVALGKAVVDGMEVIAISSNSPLGIKLLGLIVGEIAEINLNKYTVVEIF
jgi:transcription elongation GreA/GreB family factor